MKYSNRCIEKANMWWDNLSKEQKETKASSIFKFSDNVLINEKIMFYDKNLNLATRRMSISKALLFESKMMEEIENKKGQSNNQPPQTKQ